MSILILDIYWTLSSETLPVKFKRLILNAITDDMNIFKNALFNKKNNLSTAYTTGLQPLNAILIYRSTQFYKIKKVVLCLFLALCIQNVTAQNMSTTALTTCSGTYYDPGGTGNYSNNQNVTQVINPGTAGKCVQLDFSSFGLESNYDYLYIYDGNSTSATLIGIYSGFVSPGKVTASATNTTGSLTLRFTSDGGTNDLGWVATISCQDRVVPCAVQIGANTSAYSYIMPFHRNYNYGASEAIYPASEINAYGEITTLGWHIYYDGRALTSNVDIYLKQTADNTVGTTVNMTGYTLVYSGGFNHSVNGWNTVPLQTPFNYTSGNLAVLVVNKTGNSLNPFTDYSSTTVAANSTSYYYHNSNQWNDTRTMTTSNVRVNLKVNFKPEYRVEWTSSSTGSSAWCAGETRNVTLTVKNTGTQSWTSAGGNNINFSYWWNTQGHDSNPRLVPFSGLAPGQSQSVTFAVTAPATAGTYTLYADLVREGACWFRGNSGGCGPCNAVFTAASQTVSAGVTVSLASSLSTCTGVSTSLNATVTGASSMTWSPATNLSSTTIANPTASPSATTTYTLTATNGTCSISRSVEVTVNNPSTANLASNDLIFTGAVSNVYENSANWLKWNGSSFSTISSVPQITDNVRIKPNGTCIANQPTVTNAADFGFAAPLSVSANSKSIVIESGATLTFSNNASHFHVSENWTNQGTLVPANGRVKFVGSGAQSINNASGTQTFYEMNIGANSILTFNSTNVTVTNALRLDGIAVVGSNIFHLTNTAADATSLPVTAGHVFGTFRRTIASNTNTYAFPVGVGTTKTTNRRLLEYLNNNAAGITYLDCSVSNTFKGSGANTDANLDPLKAKHFLQLFNYVNSEAEWKLTPNSALSGGSYGVRLYLQNFSGLTDNNFSVLKRPDNSVSFYDFNSFYINTAMPLLGEAGRIFGGGNGYAQKTGFTSFSRFAIGSAATPLPVTLLDFSANCTEDQAHLYWSTASEKNSQHFIVQKSRDLSSWIDVETVPAAGNSNYLIHYQSTDLNPLHGISYYRLLQQDHNGMSETFGPLSVSCQDEDHGILVFPNPSKGAFTVEISSQESLKNPEISVADITGKIIATRVINSFEGTKQVYFGDMDLSTGVYMIFVNAENAGNKFAPVKLIID